MKMDFKMTDDWRQGEVNSSRTITRSPDTSSQQFHKTVIDVEGFYSSRFNPQDRVDYLRSHGVINY